MAFLYPTKTLIPAKARPPYREWHNNMLIIFCHEMLPRMLCCLCPCGLGVEKMIEYKGAAPCLLFKETKIFIFEPHGCPILELEMWPVSMLAQQMNLQLGPQAVGEFFERKAAFKQI